MVGVFRPQSFYVLFLESFYFCNTGRALYHLKSPGLLTHCHIVLLVWLNIDPRLVTCLLVNLFFQNNSCSIFRKCLIITRRRGLNKDQRVPIGLFSPCSLSQYYVNTLCMPGTVLGSGCEHCWVHVVSPGPGNRVGGVVHQCRVWRHEDVRRTLLPTTANRLRWEKSLHMQPASLHSHMPSRCSSWPQHAVAQCGRKPWPHGPVWSPPWSASVQDWREWAPAEDLAGQGSPSLSRPEKLF